MPRLYDWRFLGQGPKVSFFWDGWPTLPLVLLSLTNSRVPHPLRRARLWFLRSEQRVGVITVEALTLRSSPVPSLPTDNPDNYSIATTRATSLDRVLQDCDECSAVSPHISFAEIR